MRTCVKHKTRFSPPDVIGWRVPPELVGLLTKWKQQNEGVPWSFMLKRAVKASLKDYAGKEFQHIYEQ